MLRTLGYDVPSTHQRPLPIQPMHRAFTCFAGPAGQREDTSAAERGPQRDAQRGRCGDADDRRRPAVHSSRRPCPVSVQRSRLRPRVGLSTACLPLARAVRMQLSQLSLARRLLCKCAAPICTLACKCTLRCSHQLTHYDALTHTSEEWLHTVERVATACKLRRIDMYAGSPHSLAPGGRSLLGRFSRQTMAMATSPSGSWSSALPPRTASPSCPNPGAQCRAYR